MKIVLVAILAVLSVVLAGVLGYQKLTQPAENQSIAQNQDKTAGWKTYKNEQYGFELKLPSYFGQFETITPSERGYHLISSKRVAYNIYSYDKIKPHVSVEAKDQRDHAMVSVEIDVFPIESYAYQSNLYDNVNQSWYSEYWDDLNNKAIRRDISTRDLIIVERNGWKGYRFGWGDMGGVEYAVAIPRTNEVIEINYNYACLMEDCANPPECTERTPELLGCSENSNLKFQEILNSFKFTK